MTSVAASTCIQAASHRSQVVGGGFSSPSCRASVAVAPVAVTGTRVMLCGSDVLSPSQTRGWILHCLCVVKASPVRRTARNSLACCEQHCQSCRVKSCHLWRRSDRSEECLCWVQIQEQRVCCRHILMWGPKTPLVNKGLEVMCVKTENLLVGHAHFEISGSQFAL